MKLNLSSFARAIRQLEDALAYCNSTLAKSDSALAAHLRAAAIQAFEFTYELCIKTIKRHLQPTVSDPAAIGSMTFDELIRHAWSMGVLNEEVSQWREFRKQRGTTSHTYDENKAEDIYRGIPRFLAEAKYLYAAIEKRQSQ